MRSLLALLLLVVAASGQSKSSVIDAGPMVGHASHEEAGLWVRTVSESVRVSFRFWDVESPDAKATVTASRSGAIHRALIRDLAPGKTWHYEVLADGVVVPLDRPLRFTTRKQWRGRGGAPDFTVAIGSCAFVNDPVFDDPDRTYGGDPRIFERIAEASPDLMIWLGDNVYFREPDCTSRTGMMRRYATNRRIPELQRLLGAAHHYAIWDDHDFGPNDSDRSYPLKDESLRAFRRHWMNPPRAGEKETGGIYTSFNWSDVDFFLLDDRYFRSPNREPEGPRKVMFGEAQMQWLLDSLTSSSASFKIVVGGNQMMNPMTIYEGWGAFPDERRSFIDELERRRIEGVVFASGDRHHTELIRIDRRGAYPLFDFTSSPLLSGVYRSEKEADNPARVEGTWVHDRRNFGMLRFTGPLEDRKLTLETRGADGEIVWTHTITRDELRYPRR